jgi:tRNA nucleotidyltransferase (CCA-adding enzyme)
LNKATLVCNQIKKAIIPTPSLKLRVENKAEEIRRAVERECAKARLKAEVRLDGSVAKDTWISDYRDVDIFMRVSPELTKKQLGDVCLPIARKALKPNVVVERFAEHPYVESTVPLAGGSLRVNVVPCYNVDQGGWKSATDRSPFHTKYVRAHLTDKQRDEVRLLKAFLRGVNGYGADIKTGGFSGMLCETLVIARREFLSVLEDFSEWRIDRFIDVEDYYRDRHREIRKIFKEPLVVIDPVDKGRNLGAAVREEQLWNFVAAARHFMTKPSTSFFKQRHARELGSPEFRRLLRARDSGMICVATGRIDTVADVLWSQLYRTERALTNLLMTHDFEVIRSAAWSDEKNLNVLLFELETNRIPASKKHAGPPVSRVTESTSFVSKYQSNPSTLAGPWIESERWVVEKKRSQVSASVLLRAAIRAAGTRVGVASRLSRAFKKNLSVVEGAAIGGLLSKNVEFGRFMRTYLSGRPTWLD